jgi:hypothetical protein
VARGAEGHRRDCPASLIAVESRIEDVSPGALGVTHDLVTVSSGHGGGWGRAGALVVLPAGLASANAR